MCVSLSSLFSRIRRCYSPCRAFIFSLFTRLHAPQRKLESMPGRSIMALYCYFVRSIERQLFRLILIPLRRSRHGYFHNTNVDATSSPFLRAEHGLAGDFLSIQLQRRPMVSSIDLLKSILNERKTIRLLAKYTFEVLEVYETVQIYVPDLVLQG
jgi:hypothetical protein